MKYAIIKNTRARPKNAKTSFIASPLIIITDIEYYIPDIADPILFVLDSKPIDSTSCVSDDRLQNEPVVDEELSCNNYC